MAHKLNLSPAQRKAALDYLCQLLESELSEGRIPHPLDFGVIFPPEVDEDSEPMYEWAQTLLRWVSGSSEEVSGSSGPGVYTVKWKFRYGDWYEMPFVGFTRTDEALTAWLQWMGAHFPHVKLDNIVHFSIEESQQ